MSERRAPVLGVGERGHVRRGEIVHRADATLCDRDTDQHGRDRLGHRERREAVPIGPRILVALDEDGVATRDQESGGRVARKVVVERAGLALVLVTQGRLGGRTEQPRRRGGPSDRPTLQELVVVAEHADEEPEAIDRFDRVALARTVLLGVRAARGKTGRTGQRLGLGWPGHYRAIIRWWLRRRTAERHDEDAENETASVRNSPHDRIRPLLTHPADLPIEQPDERLPSRSVSRDLRSSEAPYPVDLPRRLRPGGEGRGEEAARQGAEKRASVHHSMT